MKKLLFLSLFTLFTSKIFAQEQPAQPQYFNFPTTEGRTIYEKIVEVNGKDKLDIYGKVLKWYFATFKDLKSKLNNSDPSIGQLVADVQADFSNDKDWYMNFSLQIDCKDNKYRVRISNIRHSVHGKEESLFSKYLVNVPVETDNEIVQGLKKGYGKGQKAAVEKTMLQIDGQIQNYFASVDKAINIKAEEF